MTGDRNLPEGWRWARFGDVVREVRAVSRDPETDGLTRIVGLEHLDPQSLPLRRWNELADLADGTSFTRVFRAGQVLFGKRRAYQRKVAVADFDGICTSDILVFEPVTDALLPEFLPYLAQSDGFFDHALGTSAGSLSPRTKFQELAKYEFALPAASDQRTIVEVLAAADRTVAAYRDLPIAIDDQRDAAAAEIWDPTGDERPLSDLAAVTVGIVVKPASLYVKTGGVPTLRSLNVMPGRLVEDELVHISPEGHLRHRKSQLHGGDVVVVRTGRPGDTAVVPDDGVDRNAIDLLIVRCGSQLRPEFLTCFLNSSSARAQLVGRSAGTAQKHLNAGQLNQVRVPIVGAERQAHVVRLVETSKELTLRVNVTATQVGIVRRATREHLLRGGANELR